MSAVGNRVCVGLLVYLARGRERDQEGETDHYQRSCPVEEVRVSQLGSKAMSLILAPGGELWKLRITNAMRSSRPMGDGASKLRAWREEG
jgi:hypothetical protein